MDAVAVQVNYHFTCLQIDVFLTGIFNTSARIFRSKSWVTHSNEQLLLGQLKVTLILSNSKYFKSCDKIINKAMNKRHIKVPGVPKKNFLCLI